jgi:hypothetical protein
MTDNLAHAFDPLQVAGSVVTLPRGAEEWRPLMPVPEGAPKVSEQVLYDACPKRLTETGFKFTNAWAYRDEVGAVLGYVVRLDRPAKGKEAAKEYCPITYCEGPGGRRRYFPKGFPEPRPLFGLQNLAARPDAPVLVVEGEKVVRATLDATLFPDHVCITSPNGSKSARKADWSPVRGRDVVVFPDNDAPGEAYAADVVEMAHAAGAASVRVVTVPDGMPHKWDVADDLPEGVVWADVEASVANAATVAAPRPDGPLPLFQPLPPADPFPVDSLGSLAVVARSIAAKIQAPLAIAGQSVLAAASLAAQAHADVRLPYGQARPLSLFFATIAESGARKTSADNEALWPVYRHEKDLREIHTEEKKTWAIAHAAWQAEKKKIEGDRKLDYAARKERLGELGEEPPKPLSPFIVTGDMTPDGLTKNWGEAHAALGIFSAEGGVFTGSHGMSDDNKLRTAAMLSELWDGKPVKRIRAMDGVTILPGRRLALHVMIQPDAASQFIGDQTLRDQGLLSRVLVSAPPSLAGSRFYKEPTEADENIIRAYGARVLSMLEANAAMAEGKRNELAPRELAISDGATAIWTEFFDHVERMLGSEEDVRGVQDFAAKAAEHAARIAGVLTIYESVHATEIGADAMTCGVELASYYVGEVLRLQSTGRANPRLLLAQRLLDWMKSTGDKRISFRDIITYGPGPLRTKEAAEAAISVLTSHGWLEEASKRPRILSLTQEG